MNNKLLQNLSWLMFAKIGQMLIQLVLGIFIARYLGPNDYGVINYIASFVTFFLTVTMLGVNSIGINEFVISVNDEKEVGEKIGSILFARLIVGILSAIFVIIIVAVLNGSENNLIFIAGLQSVALIFSCMDTFNYWFQSKQELKYAAIVQLAAYIVFALYKIILLMLGKNIIWFAFSNSVDYIFLAIFYHIAYKKTKGPKLSVSLKFLKKYFKRSYHFVLAGIMIVIYTQTDKVMLGSMLDTVSVGLYSAVIVICNMWNIIVNTILDLARPVIMKCKNEDNEFLYRKRITQTISVLIYLGLFCAVIISIFAELILYILYGKEYISAANTLRIAVWYTGFSNIGSILHIYLISEHLDNYVEKFGFIGIVFNIILNIILIPKMGINGAALATLITQILINVIIPGLFGKTSIFFRCFLNAFSEIKSLKEFAIKARRILSIRQVPTGK